MELDTFVEAQALWVAGMITRYVRSPVQNNASNAVSVLRVILYLRRPLENDLVGLFP